MSLRKIKGKLFGRPAGQVIKHPGSFRSAAEKQGMSTREFASEVLSNKGKFDGTTVKRAALAKTLMRMGAGKRK